MHTTKYLSLALLAISSAHAATTYTILDEYSNRVPTGSSYSNNTQYDQYVDAGSVDASPFVIDKLTPHEGGIVFYGSTEFNSKGNANNFRLTSTTGNFDLTSLNLLDLEDWGANDSATSAPTIAITSSAGHQQTYSAVSSGFVEFRPGEFNYFWSFSDSGIKTLNWENVEWVDFTTQYAKAKVSTLVVVAVPEPSSMGLIALGALGFMASRRRK
ncbi:PEP-CTERM sorting domain-containing protein [Akkermansiaceae bacterium]|nr:PEP-CTERM sorting domain-containing protein [Akkermansiaceae bacterium]MDB4419128.1 PEP-CTERM sorting domain-containing protein [bacterium]MDB4436100.1 PEP-CTERM sorting domain-containing protein [Akkermansiaceae bacterium]